MIAAVERNQEDLTIFTKKVTDDFVDFPRSETPGIICPRFGCKKRGNALHYHPWSKSLYYIHERLQLGQHPGTQEIG